MSSIDVFHFQCYCLVLFDARKGYSSVYGIGFAMIVAYMNAAHNKTINRFVSLVYFLLVGSCVFAQDGTRVYEFLNITTSARQAALGGNVLSAWDDDPNMALWNPALMNERMHGQLGLNYVSYLADVGFGTASVVYNLDGENFFALHGQYVDYGSFRGADEIGNETSDFSAKDVAITLGYAYHINDFFTVGANIKYINSNIETYSSSAIAADLGLVYHDEDYRTNASLVLRNFGYQLTKYDKVSEKMPFQINLGVSHELEHIPLELSLTAHDLQQFDISYPEDKSGQKVNFGRKLIDHFSVGAELFPRKSFNLRLGYNFKRGNELSVEDVRSFSGLTYGFGVSVNAFRFEFAHANYHTSGGTNHFGIIINLDRLVQGRNYWRSVPY